MAKAQPLVKVRTGPSSYIKMTEKQADAYRKANGEYGAEPAAADEPEADEAEVKAEDTPAENKARRAPAEKKQG